MTVVAESCNEISVIVVLWTRHWRNNSIVGRIWDWQSRCSKITCLNGDSHLRLIYLARLGLLGRRPLLWLERVLGYQKKPRSMIKKTGTMTWRILISRQVEALVEMIAVE